MQSKISSFFKTHSDRPPQISDQSDGEVEIFGKKNHAQILVTYERRGPKPNDSRSDDDAITSDVKESQNEDEDAANNSLGSSSLSKVLNKKRTYSQLHLELGQSDFLLHTCSVCRLAYARGDEGDEKIHKAFHRDYYQGIQFKGWRNERVVFKYDGTGDRIVSVLDSDPTTHKYKVQQVVRIMEKELGFGDGRLLHKLCQVYMFISNHRIVGCLIAEPVKTAHRVISSAKPSEGSNGDCKTRTESNSPKLEDTERKAERPSPALLQFGNIKFQREVIRKDGSLNRPKMDQWDDGAVLCEEETVMAICGIRAIWVAPCRRRKRVASKLLDATRKIFCTDRGLELDQCAFSSPTSAGKAFASNYTGSKSFLIYKTHDI